MFNSINLNIIFHGYSRSYIYSSNLLLELYKRLLLHVFSCYITILSITNDISVWVGNIFVHLANKCLVKVLEFQWELIVLRSLLIFFFTFMNINVRLNSKKIHLSTRLLSYSAITVYTYMISYL